MGSTTAIGRRTRRRVAIMLAVALLGPVSTLSVLESTEAEALPLAYPCPELYAVVKHAAVTPDPGPIVADHALVHARTGDGPATTGEVPIDDPRTLSPDPGLGVSVNGPEFDLEFTEDADALGSQAIELSGIGFNEVTERVAMLDNTNVQRIHEFDIDECDDHAEAPLVRTLTLQGLGNDVEGMTVLGETSYAVVDEQTGVIRVFEVPVGDDDLTITTADVTDTIDTGVTGFDNKGLEGLGHDGTSWFAVKEKFPAALFRFDASGAQTGMIELDLSDLSGLHAAADGTIWVASHEDAEVRGYTTDASFTEVTEIASVDLTEAELVQAEGVVVVGDLDGLHVVGETESAPDANSYAYWES